MKDITSANAADFAEQCLAFLTPLHEVGCTSRFFGSAGKNEVSDFEITLRSNVRCGFGIDGFGHEQRSLSHFEAGTVVAADGRIDFAFVDDGGVVANLRRELVLVCVTAKEQRDDDEGIFVCDKAAAHLEVGDFKLELVDHDLELTIAC